MCFHKYSYDTNTFYFRYKGKLFEEGIGWESGGATLQKFVSIRQGLKTAQKEGTGPVSLKEKRQIATDKKNAKERQLEEERIANVSIQDFFNDTYLPQVEVTKAKKSTDREKQLFKIWIFPVVGILSFKNIKLHHLEEIVSNMHTVGSAPRSIKYAMAVVRQVFNYANSHGVYEGKSPTANIKVPQQDNRRQKFLSKDDAHRLLVELRKRSLQLHDIALLSLHTGARADEIFSLTWGNIDISRGSIALMDTKNRKNRTIFMTAPVKEMLSCRETKERKTLVFPSQKGKKIPQISKSFARAVDKLGLNDGVTDRRDRVVFHTLRHTFASWLVENGENLYTVKELLGHSTLQMTERYAHLGDNTLKKAIQNFPGD